MKQEFDKLMFITNYQSSYSHIEQVQRAIDAGVKWIQYRPKEVSEATILKEGKEISALCRAKGVTLILNDRADLVKSIQADGVHLGKSDLAADKAREMLGENCIIGGTANTLDDILSLIEQKVDYVGLGPFRFTGTKKNLSPILGVEGYRERMQELQKRGINTPIYAIGGIQPEDVSQILETGVFGIAVSSVISEAKDVQGVFSQLRDALSF